MFLPVITFIKYPNDNNSVTSDPSRIAKLTFLMTISLLLDLNWKISYQPFSVIILIL